jgi:hypothetical protein
MGHMRLWIALLVFCGGTALAHAQEKDPARMILLKAIKAHGGEEAIMKLRVAEVKYTTWVALPGMGEGEVNVEETYQLPKQIKKVITGKFGGKDVDLTWAVIDGGKKWWYRDGGGETKVMDGNMDLESQYRPYLPLEKLVLVLKHKDTKLTVLGEKKEGKRVLVGLTMTPPKGGPADVYFDKETGLLAEIKHQTVFRGSDKETLQVAFLSDYKKVNDANLFHKQISINDGKKAGEVRILEVKTFEKLDDKIFAAP